MLMHHASLYPYLMDNGCGIVIYWVVTSESFSTVILSLDSKVETRSSGSSALQQASVEVQQSGTKPIDVREALDQLELVGNLAALGLDVLLGFLKVLGGRLRLKSDLKHIISTPSSV